MPGKYLSNGRADRKGAHTRERVITDLSHSLRWVHFNCDQNEESATRKRRGFPERICPGGKRWEF